MKTTRRLWQLTQGQLGVLLHERLAWLLALAMCGLVAGSAALRGFHFGAGEPRFIQSIAVGATLGVGTLLVALAAPLLFFGGIATRSTEQLLSRGVARGELLVAQALAVLVAVGWLVVLGALTTVVVLIVLGHGAWCGPALRALAVGAIPLAVLVAGSFFAAAIGRSVLFAATLTVALAVAGHLAPVLEHAAVQSSGAARAGWTVLAWCMPNFPALQAAGGWGVVAALVYAAALLGAAVWAFSHREL